MLVLKNALGVLLSVVQKCIYPFRFIQKRNKYQRIIRSLWLKPLFKHFGENVLIGKLETLHGARYISIAKNTQFGNHLFLTAWDEVSGKTFYPSIEIGYNCSFGAYNHITSINRIKIGNGVLTGKWVTITDNNHGDGSIEQLALAPEQRPMSSKGAVLIGDNVWLGDKVTVLAGVRIGNNVTVAANSVVTKDIPDNTIAGGIPAQIIKKIK